MRFSEIISPLEMEALDRIEKIEVPDLDIETLPKAKEYLETCDIRDSRDTFFDTFTLEDIMKVKLKEIPFLINGDTVTIELPTHVQEIAFESLPILPEGYGYKGGAARAVLRNVLSMPHMPVRDVDVVRISLDEPQIGLDEKVSRMCMASDFEFGDGVEVLGDSINAYMQDRDFTINEVLTLGNRLVASEACIRDTVRNIIRVTSFERNNYAGDGQIGPKMKAKALRLFTEQMYFIGEATIPPDDLNQIERSFINPFWIAVHLDRSFERSTEVAQNFVSNLRDAGVIDNAISSPEELVAYLQNEISGGFYFRNAPLAQYQAEDQDFNGESQMSILEDYFDKLYLGSKY